MGTNKRHIVGKVERLYAWPPYPNRQYKEAVHNKPLDKGDVPVF